MMSSIDQFFNGFVLPGPTSVVPHCLICIWCTETSNVRGGGSQGQLPVSRAWRNGINVPMENITSWSWKATTMRMSGPWQLSRQLSCPWQLSRPRLSRPCQRMFQVRRGACFERLYRQGFSSQSWHHIVRLECWHSCR